jgi:hypothetical protein
MRHESVASAQAAARSCLASSRRRSYASPRPRAPQATNGRVTQHFASTIGVNTLLSVERLPEDAELVQTPQLRTARQTRHSLVGWRDTGHCKNCMGPEEVNNGADGGDRQSKTARIYLLPGR